jgi:hypothetical protein
MHLTLRQIIAVKGKSMKIKISCVICLMMAGGLANADETDTLVQLDEEWGGSQGTAVLESLLAENVLALDANGIADKAQMLEDAENAEAPTGPYVAGDYQVRFLGKDVAVMVHSAAEPDPHWSMHVWQKQGGKWQVAATASVPAEE